MSKRCHTPGPTKASPSRDDPERASREAAEREQRRAADTRQAEATRLWEESGVRDTRHGKRRHGDMLKHERFAQEFRIACGVVDQGGIIVFLGDRGPGKTQCGVELIRRACSRLQSALYLHSREVGMRLREAYDDGSQLTEREAVAQLVRPHLLVVDECQERPDRDWEIRSFNLIMDQRYRADRPTVLIANTTEPQFRVLMGGAILDRIKEDGGGARVFDWPSFRVQAARKEKGDEDSQA